MIDDAAQAYNPIIQAMIATAHLQKQGQQQDIEKERNKQEAAARQEGLKQAQKALEYQHEHNLAQLEVQRMQAEANMKAQQAETLLRHQAFVHAGGDYRKVLDSVAPGLNKPLSGGAGVSQAQQNPPLHEPTAQDLGAPAAPANPFGSAEEAAALAARAAGTKAGAISQAELPAKQTLQKDLFQQQMDLQGARMAREEALLEKKQAFEKVENQLDRKNKTALQAMANQAHLQGLGMDPNTNGELMKTAVIGGMTGQYKLNPDNPFDRMAISAIQQNGGRIVDPKEAQATKEIQKLVPLFDKLDELAKQLPEGQGGAVLEKGKTALAGAFGATTDLQNKINIINSQIMNVARTTEGMNGRPLAAALKPELDSLAAITTRKNMQDRINNLRGNYVNTQDNVFFGGMNDLQKNLIKQTYGLVPIAKQSGETPDWLRLAPKKNKSGHALDETKSLELGQPVYK